MIAYSDREKKCSPRTNGRTINDFIEKTKKLFEINETVLAGSNDSFLLEKVFFPFWYNVFLDSPNFGGHWLIVSCKRSSDRLFAQATHNKKKIQLKKIVSAQYRLGYAFANSIFNSSFLLHDNV